MSTAGHRVYRGLVTGLVLGSCVRADATFARARRVQLYIVQYAPYTT